MTRTRDPRTLNTSVRGAEVVASTRPQVHLESVARTAATCRTPASQRRTVGAGHSWG